MTNYTRARRLGRDQGEEDGRQELRELLDDAEKDFGDILAAVIEYCSPEQQEEVHSALRELGEDKRGPHSWARDRLEMRRIGKDTRRTRVRRRAHDEPEPFSGRPRPGGQMDPERDYPGEDRRMAGDRMAFDSSLRGQFNRMFPNAAKIERA